MILCKDRDFYRRAIKLSGYIALQNVIVCFVGLVDNIMIGAYSQDALSGIALANQIQFLLQMVVNGAGEGMAVLAVGGVPVGVDVEHSGRGISDSIRRRWLDNCPPEQALTEWTKRESYGKLTGEGFNFALPKRPHVCRTWELNGFTITACVYDCDADSLPDNIELFIN